MAALAIAEILRHIFRYCDQSDNYRNSLVSKKWSGETLGALWYHLDSLSPLLSLLAPLVDQEDWTHTFGRPLWSHDWAIFQEYSWRVHTISFGRTLYSPSVFTDIALSRPQGDLIPNLESLVCQSYDISGLLPLFLNERLARLTVHSSGRELHKVKPLLSYLPDRCPVLRYLDLQIHEVNPEEIGFETLLSSLSRLAELHIAPALLTPCIVHALASLPSLESLVSTNRWPIPEQKEPLRPLVDIRQWFPSLTTLELSGSFAYLISFLEAYKPNSLRRLTLDPDAQETREQHHALFQAVSSCCPKIQTLHLVNWEIWEEREPPSEMPPATWNSFEPLLTLSDLTDLAIIDLPITTSTLIYLAENIPSLRRIALRRSSTVDGSPAFPIDILPQLSKTRPELEYLCLCVDTSPSLSTVTVQENERFQHLRTLDVGPSPLVSETLDIAVYLNGILPEECQIIWHWDPYCNDREYVWEGWERVDYILSSFVRDRKAAREATATGPNLNLSIS
ncbi:Leucine-rich repeat domain superfamily protein [Pleurotus pulmonarius]